MLALNFTALLHSRWGIAGFGDGPGQISLPERPTYLVGQGPTVLAIGVNGVFVYFFSHLALYHFSVSFSLEDDSI